MRAFLTFCFKAVPWLLTLLVATLVLTYLVLYTSVTLSKRVVAQWPQPDSIQYGSFGRHSLSIIEDTTCYFGTPWAHTHQIFVGRELETSGYGHSVQFSFHPAYNDLDAHIRNSKVEWTADGVTLLEASGHKLYIPKTMFIGGR